MCASVIHNKLDLVISLVDTTTGAPIEERNVKFQKDGKIIRPEVRGSGLYLLINTGRDDGLIRIDVAGYENWETHLTYGNLDENVPTCTAFLIPSENCSHGEKVLSFSGTIPSLESVEAVRFGARPHFSFGSYSAKDRIIELFKPFGSRLEFESLWYALVDGESFEKIQVVKSLPPQRIKLAEPLKGEFTTSTPIQRIVFGSVDGKGNYLLRVRDDAENLKYLVRFVIKGEESFRVIDFHDDAPESQSWDLQ